MKKVVLRAPVLTQSGYGVHSRQVAAWLIDLADKGDIKLTIQCVPWGDTTWYVNPDLLDGFVGKIMKYSGGEVKDADVSFQLILPNEWIPTLAKYNVGMTAGVETDKCNPAWIHAINQMDEIVVPSSHVAQTFKNTVGIILKPVTVIPEAFPDEMLNVETIESFDEIETDYNFLVFGQLTGGDSKDDRKNIAKTLILLINRFKGMKDVGVVLKTNLGRSSILDFKNLEHSMTKLLKDLGHDGTPRFYLLHGNMPNSTLNDLYRSDKIKALVSLTRGEGFGLPLLEAAACGLPIIATNWSAHKDYLKRDTFIDVKFNLEELSPKRIDNQIFIQGAKWAEVVDKSAIEAIDKAYKYHSIYKTRAIRNQKFIQEGYCINNIKKLYQEHFKEKLC